MYPVNSIAPPRRAFRLLLTNRLAFTQSYPSPLNYNHFPKSICTSVNETICHGIPDQRPLEDGDIINLDITLYHGGFHADLNETYYVGDKARNNPDTVRVVETARECLNAAIALVKPGMAFREPGNAIEKVAKTMNCGVVKTYCGHGVNQIFHCAPNIPHYAKNKAVGEARSGMTFTIEPMINQGTHRDVTWPDNWTSTTQDGKWSAQFGKSCRDDGLRDTVADVMRRAHPSGNRNGRGNIDSQTARLARWASTNADSTSGGEWN